MKVTTLLFNGVELLVRGSHGACGIAFGVLFHSLVHPTICATANEADDIVLLADFHLCCIGVAGVLLVVTPNSI